MPNGNQLRTGILGRPPNCDTSPVLPDVHGGPHSRCCPSTRRRRGREAQPARSRRRSTKAWEQPRRPCRRPSGGARQPRTTARWGGRATPQSPGPAAEDRGQGRAWWGRGGPRMAPPTERGEWPFQSASFLPRKTGPISERCKNGELIPFLSRQRTFVQKRQRFLVTCATSCGWHWLQSASQKWAKMMIFRGEMYEILTKIVTSLDTRIGLRSGGYEGQREWVIIEIMICSSVLSRLLTCFRDFSSSKRTLFFFKSCSTSRAPQKKEDFGAC